jgi:hypothetical protein
MTERDIATSEVEAVNGRVQVSANSGDLDIGLLIERGHLCAGVLLTLPQAQQLGRLLLDCSSTKEPA